MMIVSVEILDGRIQTPFDEPIQFNLVQNTHRRPTLNGGFQWIANFAHYTQIAEVAKLIVDDVATDEMKRMFKVVPVENY